MNAKIHFSFRGCVYCSEMFVDATAYPGYVFILLSDQVLIHEFGDDVTIKTDFIHRLSKKDDYPQLVELRQTLFEAIQITPGFLAGKQQ